MWMKTTACDDGTKGEIFVLYIEDDPASRNLLNRAFEYRRNWRLQLASNLQEAQPLLELAPNIILLDIELPDGSGYDFLSTIRCCPHTSDIPVIAVSANALHEQVESGLAAGFNHYLTKPLDLDQLFDVIESPR